MYYFIKLKIPSTKHPTILFAALDKFGAGCTLQDPGLEGDDRDLEFSMMFHK